MTPTRIVTSTVGDAPPATIDGVPIAREYGRAAVIAAAALGPDDGQLFAYPEFGFSRARQAPVITWYTALTGEFVALDRLDDAEKIAAEAYLRPTLAQLGEATSNASDREFLGAALNVPDTGDVKWNGRTAILTQWGHLPTADDRRPTEGALARFLPPSLQLVSCVLHDADDLGAQPARDVAGPAAAGAMGEAFGVSATPDAVDRPSAPVAVIARAPSGDDRHASYGAAWAMSGVALTLTLLLVYVMWPGNLIYIARVPPAPPPSAAMVAADLANSAALEHRVAQLRTGLERDICVGDVGELDRLAGLAPPADPATTNFAAPLEAVTPPLVAGSPAAPVPDPAASGSR